MQSRTWNKPIILIGLMFVLISTCAKNDELQVPDTQTSAISDITPCSVSCGGTITSDGGSKVVMRGTCWNTVPNPTIKDHKTIDGSGTGSYASFITGLVPKTTYFVRAYASNKDGIGYGKEMSFTTQVEQLAVLTTSSVIEITQSSATCGGTILSDGGSSVTDRGVCWGNFQNPSVSDSHTSDSEGIGMFTSLITGLTVKTAYYVRAFATNSAGTAYGNEVIFTVLSENQVSDIDGNVYNTIRMGTQVWMGENLKVTRYHDGGIIPFVIDDAAWSGLSTPAYTWYLNDETVNKPAYGALYNWYAVNTAKLCPAGWHVPSDAEWKTLEMYLGMTQDDADATGWRGNDQGSRLKNAGGWNSNTGGFAALPGGFLGLDGKFGFIGINGYWWSSVEGDGGNAWNRALNSTDGRVARASTSKRFGFSIRCVRNQDY